MINRFWNVTYNGRLWAASNANAIALGFAPIAIWQSRSAASVSITEYVIFLWIQSTWLESGVRNKERGMIVGMALSMLVTTVTITLALYFR
jgi:hypothetical protein